MQPPSQSAAAIAPLLARAVGEPELAAEGALAIERVLDSTEAEVDRIMARTEAEVARLGVEADRAAHWKNNEQRRHLAVLRHELTDRASALATRFEGILDLLEATERELARRTGEPFDPEPERARSEPQRIAMTVRERQVVSFSHEHDTASEDDPGGAVIDAMAGVPAVPRPGLAHGEEAPQPRRRWWRRLLLRDAA